MQTQRVFLSGIFIFLLSGFAGSAPAIAENKPEYRVGDRLAQPSKPAKSPYKLITWDDLMPKDWDPMKDFKNLNLSKMKDSDPRAQEALMRMRESWNNSPVEASMNGARIRIPGFIVPLEQVRQQITEFLLVPYYGGCIHVPPPPANQIIHVFPQQALKKLQSMDAVWVSGILETVPSDTSMGNASYRMKADIVDLYKEK